MWPAYSRIKIWAPEVAVCSGSENIKPIFSIILIPENVLLRNKSYKNFVRFSMWLGVPL